MNPQPPVTNMRTEAVSSSGATSAREETDSIDQPLSPQEWMARVDWVAWGIIALGAFLRFLLLSMKPPHFDEGINGWFVDSMVRQGFYKYDPTNYHGPLHFYILFLSQSLFGRHIFALRLPVVLASIGSIWVTLKFEPLTGRWVSRIAALAMAVSPGFIFYGRYAIHEVWLLLFGQLFILGLLGLWRFGTRGYLWCTGIGIAGMILTKETYIIHLGCAVCAVPVLWVSHKITPLPDAKRSRQLWDWHDLAVVIGVSVFAIVFFYSGTFLNWPGVKGLYETFSTWFQTGQAGKSGHEKPWPYWLKLIWQYESPVLLGLVIAPFCQFYKNMSVRYLAIYGGGVLAAYSIVHYKTPWCIISIVWPLLFTFAVGIFVLARRYRIAGWIAGGAIILASLGAAIRLNYFRCSTDTEPYVYVQTYNDIFKLTDPLLKLARSNPLYYKITGSIIRTSAYPIPWLLGDFPNVGYYESNNSPGKMDADFLLVQQDRIPEIEKKLHDSYYTQPLTIRPYQDPSKLYLNAKTFRKLFHGQTPDFVGRPAAGAR